ncbi:hypothetical protein N657DRAFT_658366 [Parathielavia appendiculata]|uniref:Uncharacterized protein n=1 Tax=Parathielavia appendiculata TaxID=2587402 RepID=A0AAN6TU22_9PEZI|nr:hypothetical protein N657DRAFT_658366 [Parathielavia appendiculata]
MAPHPEPQAAIFYTKTDFSGTPNAYKVGDEITLPGELNDKFQSVEVGVNAKVIAWQHYDGSGIYKEWEGQQPDITSIQGLTRFKVVPANTRAIAFAFQDATGGKPLQYTLKVDAADVGAVKLFSKDAAAAAEGNEYRLVGLMPEGGLPVTTAVYVRNEADGGYVAVGSVYFQWDEKDGQMHIVQDDNWPKQLKQEQTGPSAFLVTLVDATPSS